MITCRPSPICPPSIPLNDFFSVIPGPIFFRVHVEPSVKGGFKIYTNDYGTLIKLAPCTYMVKTLKNFLLQIQESHGI